METTLKGWLQSSQDQTAVANKVKGVILALSGIIILLASQFFHIQLAANDVVTLASEVSTVAGAVWAIYGVILHVVTYVGTKKTV